MSLEYWLDPAGAISSVLAMLGISNWCCLIIKN